MGVLHNERYMAAADAGIVKSAIAAASALCLQCPTCCGAEHHDKLPLAALLQHRVDQPRLGVLSAEGWVRVCGGAAGTARVVANSASRSAPLTSTSPTTFQLAPLSLDTSRPAAVVMLCSGQPQQAQRGA